MPMYRSLLTIVLLVTPGLAAPVLAIAQRPSRITTAEVDGHLRFLANATGVPTWNRDSEFRAAMPSPQP